MQPSVIGCVLLSMTVVLVTGRYSPRGNQQKQWKPIQTIYGRRPQQQSPPPPRNLENFAWTPASYVSPMKASPSRIFPRRNFIDDRFVMKFNNRKNLLLDESEENSIDDCGELNPMNNYQQEKPQQRPRRHYQQQQQYHHQPQQQPQQQYPEQKYNSYEGSNDRPASMSPRDYNYELPPDRIELIPVDLDSYSYQPKEPQVIEINGAGYAPIVLQFRSMSTPLLIKQVHQESERQHIEPTSREEPPTILKHRVIKPVRIFFFLFCETINNFLPDYPKSTRDHCSKATHNPGNITGNICNKKLANNYYKTFLPGGRRSEDNCGQSQGAGKVCTALII